MERPEVIGALSLAARHQRIVGYSHYWRDRQNRLVLKHKSKVQKLLAKARRYGWSGQCESLQSWAGKSA